jgi:hypothetical protein
MTTSWKNLKKKLIWGTLRKNFLEVKILALRGIFLSFQKCHFFDMAQKN